MSKNKEKNRKIMKVRKKDHDLFETIVDSDQFKENKLIDAVSKVCEDWKEKQASEFTVLKNKVDEMKEIPETTENRDKVRTLKYALRVMYEQGNGAREAIKEKLKEIEKEPGKDLDRARKYMEEG